MVTWDSEQYLRFKRERTQPARDLAMQLPPDDGSVTRVLDIGCGPGNSTAVLRERYPPAKILGVDSLHCDLRAVLRPLLRLLLVIRVAVQLNRNLKRRG